MKLVDFVLHEHLAKRAGKHFDLRIKYPNKSKLRSWSIPKAKIPVSTKDRFLAVETEDHAMSWLDYHGYIEKGSYGHGEVKIVQTGKVEIIRWTNEIIVFNVLEGQPMHGKYTMIKIAQKKDRNQWIISKGKDKE